MPFYFFLNSLILNICIPLKVENEVKLMQLLRQQRGGRSRSRGAQPEERGRPMPAGPQQAEELANQKKSKRVTVVDGDDTRSSPPAPRPQAESNQGSPADNSQQALDSQVSKVGETTEPQKKATRSSLSPSKANQSSKFINVNRRHQRDFNKHKSSVAMNKLLKADEALLKRQKAISGAEITSKA